jgi:hypothetical protein
MDFLDHREECMVFYQVSFFLLYRNGKRLREFEEIGVLSKAIEMTVNNKEEKFCLNFVQEFSLRLFDPNGQLEGV